MSLLSVQTVLVTGRVPTFAAVSAGGDEFPNDGNTWVEIINSSGANAYTVTFVTDQTIDGIAVEDVAISIPVSTTKKVGPFKTHLFNNSNGRIAVSYTGSAPATDLTIGVFNGV